MREKLSTLAKEIKQNYNLLKDKVKNIRESNPEKICKVEKVQSDLSVCAVDGGLLYHRMHGADIVLCRAVGVHFVYSNSKLQSFVYHPEKNPKPDVFIENSLDEHEALVFRSLIRLKEELSCSIECLEKFSPQVMLIDGSLLPLPSDCPQKESDLFKLYIEVLELYKKLYQNCNDRKCFLIGVIKDARSKKLAKEFGLNCSDSVLCNLLLDAYERTEKIPYSENNKQISVFYIKPAKNDLPLRIETTSSEIDKVAAIICGLSALGENFAYPAVLIEADMCAALDPNEIESIEASLTSLSGLKPLRRNTRPFR
ncbi:MAG: DNA double-strand break repair nuclease NurA [Candidatus Micrarchaeota archaeon]